jgi:hypothetical protein
MQVKALSRTFDHLLSSIGRVRGGNKVMKGYDLHAFCTLRVFLVYAASLFLFLSLSFPSHPSLPPSLPPLPFNYILLAVLDLSIHHHYM